MATILNKESIDEYYHDKSISSFGNPLAQLDLNEKARNRALKAKKLDCSPDLSKFRKRVIFKR